MYLARFGERPGHQVRDIEGESLLVTFGDEKRLPFLFSLRDLWRGTSHSRFYRDADG